MCVLLFDIDGTLLNTGGAGQRAMERALETVFGVTEPTNGIAAAGRTRNEKIKIAYRIDLIIINSCVRVRKVMKTQY